jgi:hypothetical protein
MNRIECKGVPDLHVSKTWYSEKVAGCQDVFSTAESGYNILRWL